jgi:hypothetical protein
MKGKNGTGLSPAKILMGCLSCVVGFVLVTPLATAQWVSQPEPRQGFPAVYVDRSHEWLFAYDDLAQVVGHFAAGKVLAVGAEH